MSTTLTPLDCFLWNYSEYFLEYDGWDKDDANDIRAVGDRSLVVHFPNYPALDNSIYKEALRLGFAPPVPCHTLHGKPNMLDDCEEQYYEKLLRDYAKLIDC